MRITSVARLGRDVSVVGLGCWQLGSDWGDVDPQRSHDILTAAADAGITFFDTADVYGDGISERTVGDFLRSRSDAASFTVATKMGRRAQPHDANAYTLDNFRRWTDRSRDNLGMDTVDLIQLHCPPSEVLENPATYDALRQLVAEGAVSRWGVSVETCDEALRALDEPDLATIQIIVNVFRRKPLEHVLSRAIAQGVGVIARVPLASGLLSGRYDETTTFAANDHRTYNRQGAAFDVGETFAGVPFEVGVRAARQVATLTPAHWSTAQLALRWIEQQGVATVIPGARSPEQARENASVGDLPELDETIMRELELIYDREIRAHVHERW